MASKLRAIARMAEGDLDDLSSDSGSELEFDPELAAAVDAESGDEDAPMGPKEVVGAVEAEMRETAPKRGLGMAASISAVRKQRVLVTCTKGITHQGRHLAQDLCTVIPHSKKEGKVESKAMQTIPEIAELKGCNNIICLESRKKTDMYMWMAIPDGPSARFLLSNIHTMSELKLTGNALKGSRPVLSFDSAFDTEPHYRLMKEMLIHTFNVPHKHKKSKPFVDRVINFSVLDGHIWFRHFQIIRSVDAKVGSSGSQTGLTPGVAEADKMELVEIGPRFVMEPIRVFATPFGGKTLWANPHYVSPTVGRMLEKKARAKKTHVRREHQALSQVRKAENQMPKNPLDHVFDE